jgi:DNA-directed RNA polymerase subunit RPC12/RpoP
MKSKNYDRQISLICSTCGESQFESDDEISEEIREYKCVSCNRIFTKDELFKENGEVIDEHLNEIGEEVLKDTAKELNKAFKKAFKGSKNIRFK